LVTEAVLVQAVKTETDKKEDLLFKAATAPQHVAKEVNQTGDAHEVMVKAKNVALDKAN
tara:strand:+ start:332 stop:508 length:177 start_codon:yes stop_codon:yes gene_type:complete